MRARYPYGPCSSSIAADRAALFHAPLLPRAALRCGRRARPSPLLLLGAAELIA